jgi:anthranilate synthase component 2
VRNDAIDAQGVRRLRPDAVVLSPGPCAPRQAGCSLEVVRELHSELPLLGVCLGHQAIAEGLGGRIVRAAEPVHGRTSNMFHDEQGVFAGIANPSQVCRYHSLAVDEASLPECLEVTARTEDRVVMGLRHKTLPVVGLQFHPESILTDFGFELLANFLRIAGVTLTGEIPGMADERRDPPREERRLDAPVTF